MDSPKKCSAEPCLFSIRMIDKPPTFRGWPMFSGLIIDCEECDIMRKKNCSPMPNIQEYTQFFDGLLARSLMTLSFRCHISFFYTDRQDDRKRSIMSAQADHRPS